MLPAVLFFYKILSMGHFIVVPCLVYRFIGFENDSNSKTQSSQRHYLLKTSMKKETSMKKMSPRAETGRSTQKLRRQQGDCLTDNLHILTENPPPSPISFPPDFVLRAQPRPPTPASQYISQNKTIQCLIWGGYGQ